MIVKNILNKQLLLWEISLQIIATITILFNMNICTFFSSVRNTLRNHLLFRKDAKKERKNKHFTGRSDPPPPPLKLPFFGDQKIDQTRPLLCLGGIYKSNKNATKCDSIF